MVYKRRHKGFDYGARTPATEEVPAEAPSEEAEPSMESDLGEVVPNADRGGEAEVEMGGEGEGRGEGEEPPQDEGAGEVEPESERGG